MPLSSDMYVPAFPQLTGDFHASASQVQLTLTAFMVGAALGYLLWGPLTDVVGRRRPLLVGTTCYTAASAACVLASNVYVFTGARFVQGTAAAAGSVIARAIVRDLHVGAAAARYFSRLLLVNGAAPILAPMIAGQMLRFTDWRAIFVVLAGIGVVMLCAASAGLPETLPRERRRTGGLVATGRAFRQLVGHRPFVAYTITQSMAGAAMFAYIGGSSFVLQGIYGVSPQAYGALFGLNAVGLVACAQVNAYLVKRAHPRTLLRVGRVVGLAGGMLLLASVLSDQLGLGGILTAFFLVLASQGFTIPNATALALADHPDAAGAGSALIGVASMLLAAIAAPLTGIAGSQTALPVALLILVCQMVSFFALVVVARGGPRRQPAPADVVEQSRIDA